jgi:hypothetical protein
MLSRNDGYRGGNGSAEGAGDTSCKPNRVRGAESRATSIRESVRKTRPEKVPGQGRHAGHPGHSSDLSSAKRDAPECTAVFAAAPYPRPLWAEPEYFRVGGTAPDWTDR